jgi:hypothetical protein
VISVGVQIGTSQNCLDRPPHPASVINPRQKRNANSFRWHKAPSIAGKRPARQRWIKLCPIASSIGFVQRAHPFEAADANRQQWEFIPGDECGVNHAAPEQERGDDYCLRT